jgi:hypothetical protein
MSIPSIPKVGEGSFAERFNTYTSIDKNIKSQEWKKVSALTYHYPGYTGPNALPICPYGCGEEGQLKEIVMGDDGQAVGIFCDSDGCVFRADIEIGEPPSKRKLVIGPDGELKEEGGE